MLLRGRLRRLCLLLLPRGRLWRLYLMLLRRRLWLTRPLRRFLFLLMFALWRLRNHDHAIWRRGMDRSNDNS
jgi:hypothetical protein